LSYLTQKICVCYQMCCFYSYICVCASDFFFQAEDGIRDFHVTGVQTCALPISSYWLSLDIDTLARHAELVRTAEREKRAIMIDLRIDTWRAITEVTIYTADHPGLFSQIAGAMALSGASIVDAKIYTMTNGKALDIFWIQDAAHGAFDEPERLARLDRRIEEALTGQLRPQRELARRQALPDRVRMFNVPPRVLIDNAASATHTVIEVNGRDRPGLLHDVTRALTDLGLQISTA